MTDLDLTLAERLANEIEEKGGRAVGYEPDDNQEQTDAVVNQAATDSGPIDIIFVMLGSEKFSRPTNYR